VARTVYPRARSSLTIQDAMYPDAPVTHTTFPAPVIAAAAELMPWSLDWRVDLGGRAAVSCEESEETETGSVGLSRL
jgi:hypothetical protein